MGTRYTSYEDALKYLCLDTLFKRIEMLCLAFALKCLKNPKFKYLFQTTPELEYNLKKERRFVEPHYDTERLKSSPLTYLTRLLNAYFDNI